jgi:hypothetical protein
MQFSKALIFTVACASVLAACAGKVGSDRTATTVVNKSVEAKDTKIEQTLEQSAVFMMVEKTKPGTEEKTKVATGTITLKDPTDETKLVTFTTEKFKRNDLLQRVEMSGENESKTASFSMTARCEEMRGDVCDLVVAFVEKTDKSDPSVEQPVAAREVLYFERKSQDSNTLVVAHHYSEGLGVSGTPAYHLAHAIARVEELRTETDKGAVLSPAATDAVKARFPFSFGKSGMINWGFYFN